jgi:hypothetical protein
VEKASISSAGAFTSTTIDATKLTGEKRNFIIDGDFTQWPEGTGATSDSGYTSALFQSSHTTAGTITTERSTDVPTVAQSNHTSSYSKLSKCTGTDVSIAAGDTISYRYYMTGSDFAHLHQQQVTLSFWHKTAAANSGDTYAVTFMNGSFNRSYIHEYTSTSSWQQETVTLTLDTSGTWLFTEADVGLRIIFTYMSGTTFQGTADAWSGNLHYATSNTSNFMDNTSNEVYLSQVSLTLGSTAPTFSSPPIATVKDQMDWYVQRWNFDQVTTEHGMIGAGHVYSTNTVLFTKKFDKELRAVPAVTSSGSGTFEAYYGTSQTDFGALTAGHVGKHGCRLTAVAVTGTPFTVGEAVDIRRDGTDVCWIMADSRH